MKWMLLVLVFGMRKEYARTYSQDTWGAGIGEANDPSVVSRFGQRTTATCVPHA